MHNVAIILLLMALITTIYMLIDIVINGFYNLLMFPILLIVSMIVFLHINKDSG